VGGRGNWFGLDDATSAAPDVAIVGLPFDGAVSLRAGAAQAPARLRELSRTSDPISRRGQRAAATTVRDYGDVPTTDRAGTPLAPDAFRAAAARRLAAVPATSFLLALGGDNSVSVPVLEAFARRHDGDIGIVWFDAHPDLFPAYAGSRDSHACALRRALDACRLPPSQAVLVGTRSFAEEELRFIQREGMGCITATAWAEAGPEAVAEQVAGGLTGRRAVYLAVDIDGFDAACAPGTGYPLPGGIAAGSFFRFQEALFARLPVRAMDLTEIAPPLDTNDITAFLGVQIVLEVLALLATPR